jgi:site-specific DNA recombinase
MKAEDAREGLPNGGGRPYGFEEDQVTLRPSEVANLIEAKDRYLAGETVRDVVRDFYARGVLSPYGKPWQIENFTRVLFNKRYLGIRVHNGVEYPAVWPAIFTQAEWDRMNARRLTRAAKWPGRGRGVGRKYLLTGLCVCGLCGGYMVGSRKQSGQNPIRRYKCRRVDNYGNAIGCGRVFRAADPLEAWITEAVLYRFDSPEVNLALAEPEEPDRTDELVQAYNEARDNLDQMVADYASRLLTREQFALAKTVAEGQVEAAMTALSRYQRRNINIQLPEPGMMREVWETAGMDWKHQVIKLLVEKIEVLPGHPGSHMWRSWRFSPELVRVSWRVLAKAAGRWLICRPVFRFYPAQLCWL